MKKWTLKELHFVGETLFPDRFRQLFAKYANIVDDGDKNERYWYLYAHCASFKACNNDLLTYIMSQSRASADNDGLWDIWDKMIAELLKKELPA